jgi:hypothetical protein
MPHLTCVETTGHRSINTLSIHRGCCLYHGSERTTEPLALIQLNHSTAVGITAQTLLDSQSLMALKRSEHHLPKRCHCANPEPDLQSTTMPTPAA